MKYKNPLYPFSNNKGVKGAYETAVLIDDSDETLSKTKSKQARAELDLKFITNTNKSYHKFSKDHREIMQNYKTKLNELKQQKESGKISNNEFHKLKQALAKETNSRSRTKFKDFLLGK